LGRQRNHPEPSNKEGEQLDDVRIVINEQNLVSHQPPPWSGTATHRTRRTHQTHQTLATSLEHISGRQAVQSPHRAATEWLAK
jgi:hypothetical protein